MPKSDKFGPKCRSEAVTKLKLLPRAFPNRLLFLRFLNKVAPSMDALFVAVVPVVTFPCCRLTTLQAPSGLTSTKLFLAIRLEHLGT